jgi:hypothetical protein
MKTPLEIRYINLEESVERRARLTADFRAKGIEKAVKRQPAIKPDEGFKSLTRGEYGCLLSHKAALMSARKGQSILILEDDVLLASEFVIRLAALWKNLSETGWDILFLGQTAPYFEIDLIRKLLQKKWEWEGRSGNPSRPPGLLEGSVWYRWGAFAYIVNGASVERIASHFDAPESLSSPIPVDLAFKKWAREGKLRSLIAFPYLVGINDDDPTTMEDREDPVTHGLHAGLVNLFLLGHQAQITESEAKYIESSGMDRDAFIVSRAIGRRISADAQSVKAATRDQ